jgi:hypothetical protein
MATNWNNLRPWNGSQEKAFEELCCQFAAGEHHLSNSRFIRKGTPDAGVECFWQTPSGDEYGWQAKFFVAAPTSSQWAQIDHSVNTALEKHPRLTRYTVCFPVDRSDARISGQKSFLVQWNERVAKWESWARKRKMSVAFVYWGDSELTSRLDREENRGRYWFWFNREQFTAEWFRKKLEVAITNAGDRYTPELHVDLPISKRFDALGRTPAFHGQLNSLYQKLRGAGARFRPGSVSEEARESATQAAEAVRQLSGLLDEVLVPIVEEPGPASVRRIPTEKLAEQARTLSEQLYGTWNALHQLVRERPRPESKEEGQDATRRKIEEDAQYCLVVASAANELASFCCDVEAVVANNPALLLGGEAGQGKTHLFCDVAERDMKAGRPRILLHGSHFADAEPWSQIVRMLGLNCTTDEFLGALEAAGQAYGCRILVLIDALNEGDGRALWEKYLPGMLTEMARSPWLGIAVSVRSSYEALVIPDGLVPGRLTRVVHYGFQEHEYEAVHRFFQHFGIQPTIPLLVPEFTKPLFLKLFCQSMHEQGLTQVPLGLRGITAILDSFVVGVNRKLSRRMNYDERSNLVQKAIDLIVTLMAEKGCYRLPRETVVAAVNKLHPTPGYEQSLFRNLVTEGVLAENNWYGEKGTRDVVQITYERFGDHLLARCLLDRYLNPKSPGKAFGPGARLGKLVKTASDCWRHAGLLEAFSVQLPERVGKELVELAKHTRSFGAVQRAFIQSLVWRDAKAFGKGAFEYFDSILRNDLTRGDVLDAMLTVAPVPDHPLNAEGLHRLLSAQPMPQRDAWWSVFLPEQSETKQAVDRLVDWAWGDSGRMLPSDDVVILAGTALGWFLTSSNRFLRDRATKALVRLFDNKLTLLTRLLERFRGVDDPYVTERLMAVAYGCAMRCTCPVGLAELAAEASAQVFGNEGLIPQILTREYASGVVESAKVRGAVGPEAFPESIPPYRSKWPAIKIPSSKTLEKWGKWRQDMGPAERGQSEVYSSITGHGLSDFSNYVIGDMDEWTSVRIGTSPPKSTKEQYDAFRDHLSPKQRTTLIALKTVFENVAFYLRLDCERRREILKRNIADDDLRAVEAHFEGEFLRLLKRNPAKLRLYKDIIQPYLKNPHQFQLEHPFDDQAARRWMVQRVIDYGWTAERFGGFDDLVRHGSYEGWTGHKAERIGKKYQWIAYHELLARLSDNFYLRKERYGADGFKVYSGTWDIGYGHNRDIDPSVTIRKAAATRMEGTICWWSPVSYSNWNPIQDDVSWLKTDGDLPSLSDMVRVRKPEDSSEWFVLDTHLNWKEPARPGWKDYDRSQRSLYYIIRSYFVRKADAASFFRWAKGQHYMGRWMPEPYDVHGIALGEFFWSPWFRAWSSDAELGWTRGDFDRVPYELLVPSLGFLHEASGFDCSLDESFSISLPAPDLVRGLGLSWGGIEGRYVDASGELVAFDPSVHEPGPRALLVRTESILRYLSENGLELFWTVLGEKQMIGGGYDSSHLGWLEVDGVYRLSAKGIVGGLRAEHRLSGRGSRRPKARQRRPK